MDVLDDGFQNAAGVGLRDTGILGDGGDEFSLSGHYGSFPEKLAPIPGNDDEGINAPFA